MIIDCHVHVCATLPGHGRVSARLRRSLTFRFLRWRLNLPVDNGARLERTVARRLLELLAATPALDAVVLLAFDAVYDRDGRFDAANTHLYVTNDYALDLCQRSPKLLFGASVHPYRKDAVAELERCIARGAVLLKWLPIVQNMNPADERCFPLYEMLAHYKLPLLCHTGGENALPNLDRSLADPVLLEPALKRGVTVIAAHCGTRSTPREPDYAPTFVRMVREHERFYGDTAALNLPTRSYVYPQLLEDPVVRSRLVHGSDWPIPSLPPLSQLGAFRTGRILLDDGNWLRRDVETKRQLGFDDAYWHRAATLLRGVANRDATTG